MRRRRFSVFVAFTSRLPPESRYPGSCFGTFFLPRAGIYFVRKRYISVLIAFLEYEGIAKMNKILFVIPLVLITSAASAQQQQQRQQGHDACARDVSRHCRAQMQSGDQIVLACLKQNRAKISKGCQQMLASHGQ
jgi:hypothetical protein